MDRKHKKDALHQKILAEATTCQLSAGEVIGVLASVSHEIETFAMNTSVESFVGLRLDVYGNVITDERP